MSFACTRENVIDGALPLRAGDRICVELRTSEQVAVDLLYLPQVPP